MKNSILAFGLLVAAVFAAARHGAGAALRSSARPVDGAMGFQPAATELARDLQWLDWHDSGDHHRDHAVRDRRC